MTTPSFGGLRVLALESRREKEMAALITAHGGEPRVAASMREVPLESNAAAVAFADALLRGEFDVVILLTGVGTRVLLDVVERVHGSREPFVAALGRARIAVRGPKPLAVLRELGLTPWVVAGEPNTSQGGPGGDRRCGGRRALERPPRGRAGVRHLERRASGRARGARGSRDRRARVPVGAARGPRRRSKTPAGPWRPDRWTWPCSPRPRRSCTCCK